MGSLQFSIDRFLLCCVEQLPFLFLIFPYMGYHVKSNKCFTFIAIVSFALLQSNSFKLYPFVGLICYVFVLKFLPSIATKNLCVSFGTQTARKFLARHKKKSYAGTLTCPSCSNSSATTDTAVYKCKAWEKVFTDSNNCESLSGK